MSCLVGEELGFGPVLATAHKPKHPRLLKPGALRACVHLVSVAVTGVLVLLRGLVHHRRLGGTGLQTTTIELSFAQRAVVQRRRHRDQWFPLDAGFVLTDERIGVVGHPCGRCGKLTRSRSCGSRVRLISRGIGSFAAASDMYRCSTNTNLKLRQRTP